MKIASVYYRGVHPFDTFFPSAEIVFVDSPEQVTEDIGLLIFHGGADISPSIYGQKAARWCYAGDTLSRRDEVELACMKRAAELKVPTFGICRGAQLQCAFNGGTLVQDVDNHSGVHQIITADAKSLTVNSIHHQMMLPDAGSIILAWAPDLAKGTYMGEKGPINVNKEAEAVYFPRTRSFGVQWHPEMMEASAPATRWVFNAMMERGIL